LNEPVEVNDIIQIVDGESPDFATLLIVAEVRPEGKGVWAYVPGPDRKFMHLRHEQFVVVGGACAVIAEFDDDPEETDTEEDENVKPEPKRSALN